jgi:hypothetical protein
MPTGKLLARCGSTFITFIFISRKSRPIRFRRSKYTTEPFKLMYTGLSFFNDSLAQLPLINSKATQASKNRSGFWQMFWLPSTVFSAWYHVTLQGIVVPQQVVCKLTLQVLKKKQEIFWNLCYRKNVNNTLESGVGDYLKDLPRKCTFLFTAGACRF